MKNIPTVFLTLLLLALPTMARFHLNTPTQTHDSLRTAPCHTNTHLAFAFSPNSISRKENQQESTVTEGLEQSAMVIGSQKMQLVAYDFVGEQMLPFVEGFRGDIQAAAVLKFTSQSSQLYLYIPFTSTLANSDVTDLTSPTSSLPHMTSFTGQGPLSVFNFLNEMDYDIWYSQSKDNTTVLVNRFIYRIGSITVTDQENVKSTLLGQLKELGLDEDSVVQSGKKICAFYSMVGQQRLLASPYGYDGYFETNLRSIVALWFIFCFILLYWLYYLFVDANTKSLYDQHRMTQNRWTCWSLYSIHTVSHEQFFTRLSRMTVILMQLTFQGIIISAIIQQQYTKGPAIIIWSAVIAWVATIIFPFLWGYIFHRNIYEKSMIKFDNRRKIRQAGTQKEKEMIPEYQQNILVCQQKLYGYYHWFYSICFALFVICWPITIHLMQKLPEDKHVYNWYWLAALTIAWVFDTFILQIILALALSGNRFIRMRGGYYYDIRLGMAHHAIADL